MTTTPPPTPRTGPISDASGLVLDRLIFPRSVPAEKVSQMLRVLAADGRPGRILVETTRTGDTPRVEHLLGTTTHHTSKVRGLLEQLLPGVVITSGTGISREKPQTVARMVLKPDSLPLNTTQVEATVFATYQAFTTRLHPGERLSLQVVLGAGIHPASTPAKLPDPRPQGLLGLLARGVGDAPTEVRKHIAQRRADYGFKASIRIGVTASNPQRRERLANELISALAVLEAPGIDIALRVENPGRFYRAELRRPLRLAIAELVGMLGLPVADPKSDQLLPGMPVPHPKLTRLDPGVSSNERVFAKSLFPGDERFAGLPATDGGAMRHMAVIAPTGAGKSRTLERLAIDDAVSGRALVYIDPKADGAAERILANIPKHRWEDIVLIDPSDPDPPGFNPLDATGRDPDVVADNVAAVFAKLFADGWGPRTADIFLASLRTLARTGTKDHPHTIVDIQRLWLDAAWRKRLTSQATVQEDPALQNFWSWYDGLGPEQAANVLAAPANKLRMLLKPAAVKILGQRHSGSTLRNAFTEKKIVILASNPATAGELTVQAISSLAIADVWGAVQERGLLPAKKRHPAIVYVDEADRLMALPVNLADALQRSRSYAVGWVLALQAFSQASKDIQAALRTNARSMLVWKTEDNEEAARVAKMAPELQLEDWMALPKYQAYARIAVDGVSTPWALVQLLPPLQPEHDPAEVLAASKAARQQKLAEKKPPPEPATDQAAEADESASQSPGFGGKHADRSGS